MTWWCNKPIGKGYCNILNVLILYLSIFMKIFFPVQILLMIIISIVQIQKNNLQQQTIAIYYDNRKGKSNGSSFRTNWRNKQMNSETSWNHLHKICYWTNTKCSWQSLSNIWKMERFCWNFLFPDHCQERMSISIVLHCQTVWRRYKDWGSQTYGGLIKKETQATEIKCIWHSSSDNPLFVLAGFKGSSEEI